jgi:sec-independent protein translocase protein TatC
MNESSEHAELSLIDHLAELRDRLIWSAWAVAAGAALCWAFSEQLFDLVRQPIAHSIEGGSLIFTNPLDKFMAHMKLAISGGVLLACPVWIYNIWRFIAPGLYARERKYSSMFIAAGTLLFVGGSLFAYYLVLPTGLKFLLGFGGNVDKPMITISEYMSFFTTMILVFGGAFELPLIIVMMGVAGIVDQKFLREKRRYAIVLIAVVAAFVTPPDVMSMLMLLVPLCLLYEISILLVGVMGKKKTIAE